MWASGTSARSASLQTRAHNKQNSSAVWNERQSHTGARFSCGPRAGSSNMPAIFRAATELRQMLASIRAEACRDAAALRDGPDCQLEALALLDETLVAADRNIIGLVSGLLEPSQQPHS